MLEMFPEEKQVLASQNIKERDYWVRQFQGGLQKNNFPYDYESESGESPGYKEETRNSRWTGSLVRGLVRLSNGFDPRLHMILTAAVLVLLYRYGGDREITVGAPLYRQKNENPERLLNTILPLKNHLEGEMSLREVLLQVRQTVVEATEHQNYPMEILLKKLGIPYNGKNAALYDVAVMVENIHDKEYLRRHLPGVLFSIHRRDGFLDCRVQYNGLLYGAGTIERILGHLEGVLREFTGNIDEEISRLEFMTAAEKKQVLEEFNQTYSDYSRDLTLDQRFQQQQKKTPHHIAVVHGHRQLTYLALNERANQGAWQLIARGVGREDVIGIMMDRTQDLITVMFSVLKAGAAYLPLDPEYPPAHLGQMLENSGAGMLVTNSLPREGPPTGFAGFAGECLELDRLSTAAASKADPPAVNKPENLAYIIYTSGSTGKPKGVMIEHRNVIAYVHSAQELLHLTPGDTKTQHSSFSFDQFVEEVYPVLFVGGRLVILDKYQLSDPQELRRIFINHGVTVFNTTPALLNQINQSALSLAGHLKTIIVGGDVLKSRYISNIFPQVNLYNFYGPTETTVCATHHLCTGAEDEGEQIPIGKPKANYLLYVLDSHLQPLPPGVPGEILIAGPGVGRGYLNAPEITADKFLDNPFHPGMRMYRTGDLGRWRQDGSLQFIARKDRQVKIRGYRIELTEIEKGLLGYPEIKDAVVIAREQGEDKVLCAYYVRTAENRTETEEDENRDSHVTPLKQHLARLLPDFMIPAFFTQLPEIPRTAAGKADLHRLPQPTVTAGNQYLAPTSPLEEKLVEIWAEVLSLEKEKISIQRSFFELGGHSLKAVALTAKIHKSLHVKIPLVDLFETQTVKELALYIQEANPRQYSPIKKIAQRDDYELSYSQRFFLKSTVYSAPMAFLLEGNFDKKAFQNALLTLLERNEVLRTLYPSGNGLTRQKIVAVAEMNFILEEIDLIGESENSSQIKDLFDKDLYTPYNMSSGPLVRAKLIRLAEKKYLFSLITHHIMVDGTSNLLLSKELTILYAAYAAGEENPLPPLPLQYKDYAAWQIEQVQSGAYRAHRQYWLELFSGGIPRLNLATDFPRPAVKTWAGGSTAFYLNQELSDGIFAITRLQKTTFYICLLAVATALLFKYTGQKDIVVGTWSAGRQREEISQLIGNFLNPFALRMKFSPADQFIDFVQKVKQAALSALEHQDYPLLEISRELQLQEDPARAVYGLFDVMIKVYNFDVPMKNDIRRLEDLTISHYPVDFPICKRDLDFDFFDVNGKIEGNIKYSTQLYKHETILRLKNHFIKIVEQVTLNNKIKLQDLSLTE